MPALCVLSVMRGRDARLVCAECDARCVMPALCVLSVMRGA